MNFVLIRTVDLFANCFLNCKKKKFKEKKKNSKKKRYPKLSGVPADSSERQPYWICFTKSLTLNRIQFDRTLFTYLLAFPCFLPRGLFAMARRKRELFSFRTPLELLFLKEGKRVTRSVFTLDP